MFGQQSQAPSTRPIPFEIGFKTTLRLNRDSPPWREFVLRPVFETIPTNTEIPLQGKISYSASSTVVVAVCVQWCNEIDGDSLWEWKRDRMSVVFIELRDIYCIYSQ